MSLKIFKPVKTASLNNEIVRILSMFLLIVNLCQWLTS